MKIAFFRRRLLNRRVTMRVIGFKDRRNSEALAQDLAREIEIYEAPTIALWKERVRTNELRRLELRLIARIDAEAVDYIPRLLRKQAV